MKLAFSKTKTLLALVLAATSVMTQAAQADHARARSNPFANHVASTSTDLNPDSAIKHVNALSVAFRAASNKILPTLVAIETNMEGSVQSSRSHENPFLNPQSSSPSIGIGSGVMIDPSGIVLTNSHVVAGGMGSVIVRLSDGREFPAVEVLTDPKSDIAVVRIEGADTFVAAPMGDSDNLEIGDWVLALGQPFGLESTVTAGIISAKQRGIGMSERESFLQTDAAINPGNSGGPLVNLNGEVIGINTAISSRSGGNEGIGFAIPINLARWVGGQLMEHGSVHRAYLGVGVQELTATLARQFGVQPKGGVVVTLVQRNSPAATANLKVGDIIVSYNATLIHNPSQLQLAVEQCEPGQSQTLEIIRAGKQMSVGVTPAQPMAEEVSVVVPESVAPAETETETDSKLGMRVEPLRPEIAERIGVTENEGVVVTEIVKGGVAHSAGLEPGAVIAEINHQSIHNIDDFASAIKQADINQGVLMLVKSADGSRFLFLKAAG